MKRDHYGSAEEYISDYQRQMNILRRSKIAPPPFISTGIMIRQLQDELPDIVFMHEALRKVKEPHEITHEDRQAIRFGGGSGVIVLAVGFLKSTIHRVVTPPRDQINIPRLGLLYFCRPGDNTIMKTVPSPVLDRLGLLVEDDKDPNKHAATGTEYVRARVRDVHYKKVIDKRENTSFEFKGLKVANHYE
ncbi:hypothetical protein N7460_010065 [Penicillium canescens]|uniref:Isopenicillin N synthase-like Fe(2+) 2OG dioxygenase domain-containing protein n=1 Tax=Penicillium canescens TaxID=5083 RepID=A0AAD6N494_PENCN|nr:hypothetical protein N7460_010065 [Penicillium canescens]